MSWSFDIISHSLLVQENIINFTIHVATNQNIMTAITRLALYEWKSKLEMKVENVVLLISSENISNLVKKRYDILN